MEGTHAMLSSHGTTKRRGKRSETTPWSATIKKPLKSKNPPQPLKRDASSNSRRSVPHEISSTAAKKTKSRGASQFLAVPQNILKTTKVATATSLSSPRAIEKKRPSTWEMIRNALLASRARKGVSRPALTKFIREQYGISIDSRFNATLRRILRSNLEKGELTQVAHSYKLTSRAGQTPPKCASSQSTPKRGAQRQTSSRMAQQKRTDGRFGVSNVHERSKSVSKQEAAGQIPTRNVPSAEPSFTPKKRPLIDSGDVSPIVSSLLKRHKKSCAAPTGDVAPSSPKKISSALKVKIKTDALPSFVKKTLSQRSSVSHGQPKSSRKQQPERASSPVKRRASRKATFNASLSTPPRKTGMRPARSPMTQKIAASRTPTARSATPTHELKFAQTVSPAMPSEPLLSKNKKRGRPVSKIPNSAPKRPTKLSK